MALVRQKIHEKVAEKLHLDGHRHDDSPRPSTGTSTSSSSSSSSSSSDDSKSTVKPHGIKRLLPAALLHHRHDNHQQQQQQQHKPAQPLTQNITHTIIHEHIHKVDKPQAALPPYQPATTPKPFNTTVPPVIVEYKDIHIHKQDNKLKDLFPRDKSLLQNTPSYPIITSPITNKMAKHDYYDEDSSYAQSSKSSSYGFKPTKETKSTSISSVHTPSASTFTIPCHHIRIGDLVILQQRPCQIIRITTSAQTGQHRYLGVDLFTKQLHEEPCVVSHPSPSVVLHSLLGPVFKQYRLIDIRDDGKLVAMTESGEIKQGLKVVDQGNLYNKLREAYGKGSGSVRVLVIADQGKELAVDYKIVHLAHKL
jgi:hypothetical protein